MDGFTSGIVGRSPRLGLLFGSTWKRISRSTSGVVALESLIVLPLQIFMLCCIVQLAHFIIAHQFTHYAAFAAARAVLVEDTQTMSSGTAFSTSDRAWQAAAHACSPMEVFSADTGSWIELPTGGKFRDRTFESRGKGTDLVKVRLISYDKRPDGDIEVEVTYGIHLPVPFANRAIFEGFKRRGEVPAGKDLRINITQRVIMAKPWE